MTVDLLLPFGEEYTHEKEQLGIGRNRGEASYL